MGVLSEAAFGGLNPMTSVFELLSCGKRYAIQHLQ